MNGPQGHQCVSSQEYIVLFSCSLDYLYVFPIVHDLSWPEQVVLLKYPILCVKIIVQQAAWIGDECG